MGTPVINENSHVWVEDQTFAWIDGKVLKINGREAEIETRNGMVVANLSKLYPKDTELPDGGVDDMANLSYLHEPGVLQNLAARYTLEKIYTYTGNTLIAINPFQSLSYLYNADMMEKYKGVSLGELSPHVFSIADAAYRAMVNEGKSNSILVSGESGAGKTETTKMLMRYLVYLGGHAAVEGQTVEQQVLESNPVLEAFGNAKTVRNNNSSRFGKFVEIQFDTSGRISGAAIRTYLLERSRVCQISDPERNYHCFYRLCAAPRKDVEKYKLGNPRSFHYLNQSNCHELADVNESHEYQATKRAMDIVGVSEHEQDAIFRVVAAILHLGNIDFSCGEEIDSSVLKDGNSRFHLEMTAELLMCDPHALEDALCKRVMITREEVIKRSLDPVGAMVSRDGLAKTIYSRLFEWLVDKINVSIGQDLNSKSCIGVLDIYGFESFKTNSFEQFCINFTNEKLQHYFNEHVFKMEQDEYSKEGIDWSYIEFVDNQDVLDLIEKKPGGIFALLDEACMFPKSSHESFSQKLYQMYKDHKRFIKPKLARTDFIIAHYAGQVHYQSDQFLDKNKDYVSLEHQGLLSSSRCCFISGLFPLVPEETTKFTKFSSIGSRFKLQLQQLMDTLNSMDPHFVRCVKPNCLLKPAFFDNVEVVQQLRSGGVLEAIRISCAGYPTRKTFHEFLRRFGIVVPAVLEGNFGEELACKRILEMTGMVEFQMGKSKVFLKDGPMAELDARKGEISSNSAKAIQGRFRTYVTRKKYIVLLNAAIYVQSFWRGRLAFKSYQCIKREAAAIMIQKRTRGHLVRGAYSKLKFSVLVLQTGLQAMAARMALRYRREAKATLTIQACWRCHRFCSHFRKLRWASIISQCRRRGVIATRELRKLKVAANEVVSLKQSKYEFEKQVEELSWKLELEKRLKSDLEEAKDEEITNLQHALQVMLKKVDETYEIFVSKQEAAQTSAVKPIHVFTDDSIAHNTILMETLATEVDKLMSIQELSLSEKQRTDDFERKYKEALKSNEDRQKKLEEAERRVHQLQDSLNRMIYSMSGQFQELKMILRASSSTSASIPDDHEADVSSASSDNSSTNSEFTFPTPSLAPVNGSPFNPDALQLLVQDMSVTEISGSENCASIPEGGFDDFF